MDRWEYLHRQQWDAMKLLERHELLDETYWYHGGGGRWLIGRPGESFGLTEIIAGTQGSLVVHGDFELCRFAYQKCNAWQRLLWMADCHDLDHYVAEKAQIGMRRIEVDEYDERVARHGIAQYAVQAAEDAGDDDDDKARYLRGALEYTESRERLREYLSTGQASRWDLWEYRPGLVLGSRVIIAHMAMNKCAALLRERHGEEGPPACRPKKAA